MVASVSDTVFYAWQNDHPANTNRNLICDAVERAIEALNAELGVDDALRADQDTKGVPGDINVAEVIFEKIDRCRIFVADITTITPVGAARPTPNPNVLVEYGRASVHPGSEFVITVFNEAFGSWLTERPFDLRHKRKPLLYTLPKDHSPEERIDARKVLVSQLTSALREMLNATPVLRQEVSASDFQSLRTLYGKTLLETRATGRIIGFWCGLIPVGGVVRLEAPWDHPELVQRATHLQAYLGNTPLKFGTMEEGLSRAVADFAPIQGGARCIRQYHYASDRSGKSYADDSVAVYLRENGEVAVVVRTNNLVPGPHLNLRWIMADVANSLVIVDRVRRAAGRPTTAYALLVELRYDDQTQDTFQPVRSGEWRLCRFEDEQGQIGTIVPSEPITVGPVLIGAAATFPDVLKAVYTRIITSAGRRPETDLRFDLQV